MQLARADIVTQGRIGIHSQAESSPLHNRLAARGPGSQAPPLDIKWQDSVPTPGYGSSSSARTCGQPFPQTQRPGPCWVGVLTQ